MTLARCPKCTHKKPPIGKTTKKGITNIYKNYVLPVGYPATASICGTKNCENSAHIWLNQDEEEEFKNGQRIFSINTGTMKVKVENDLCNTCSL
jgi:hypothetical protein